MAQQSWTKTHSLDECQLLTESVSGETSVWVTISLYAIPCTISNDHCQIKECGSLIFSCQNWQGISTCLCLLDCLRTCLHTLNIC